MTRRSFFWMSPRLPWTRNRAMRSGTSSKKQKTEGKTVILTTHYMEEAEELCDRVGIIDHGKLIALGKPKELIAKNQVKNLEELFIKLTGRTIREEA